MSGDADNFWRLFKLCHAQFSQLIITNAFGVSISQLIF
jgi:hypothetical protein